MGVEKEAKLDYLTVESALHLYVLPPSKKVTLGFKMSQKNTSHLTLENACPCKNQFVLNIGNK